MASAPRSQMLVALSVVLACLMVASACGGPGSDPRNIVVLVGAGRGTASVNAFFPERVRIRTGDTVTWRVNADGDPHTVTFTDSPDLLTDIIPAPQGSPTGLMFNPELVFPTREEGDPVETYSGEGYVNSGMFFGAVRGVPSWDTFSLVFDAPGTYAYVCGIHEFMTGTAIVEPRDAPDIPGQEEIDREALAEMAPLVDLTSWNQQLVASRRTPDQEEHSDGTSLWIVSAGIGPRVAEVVDFMPKRLTVAQGDTVAWVSSGFHSVVFHPGRPDPPFYVPMTSSEGRPVVGVNTRVTELHRPSGDFDDSQFYTSGLIGPGVRWFGTRPSGVGFALTFRDPGTYEYTCPIHRDVGMVGYITVEPRAD